MGLGQYGGAIRMKPTQPSVLIIILNYGTYEMTINLIKQLQNNLAYDSYSIMVVDNCSPNKSAEVLESKSKEMDFIFYANKVNAGYAAGNNIGIRYGIKHGYCFSWILNNDIELREKNVLSHMVEIAEKNDKIGCIGPKIYTLDGSICAPYCRRPTFWSMTGGIVSEKKYRHKFINKSGAVYRAYGCCMLLKNKAMADINCMDERTFLYGEEDILAERLLAKGYISYYDADVSITHKESFSMRYASINHKKLQIRETSKSMELYLREYRRFPRITRWICKNVRNMITWIR